MNETALFRSVNLEITKYLNNHLAVYIEDFDDEYAIVSFDAVSVILPKAMLLADVNNLQDSKGRIKAIFDEVQSEGSIPFYNFEKIGKDYFIGDDCLYYVEDFGDFKGMTFNGCVSAIINNQRWIVLKNDLHKPLVLLMCGYVYSLEKADMKTNECDTDDLEVPEPSKA